MASRYDSGDDSTDYKSHYPSHQLLDATEALKQQLTGTSIETLRNNGIYDMFSKSNDESDTAKSSHHRSQLSDTPHNTTNTLLRYKCDYCEEAADNIIDIKRHLSSALHFSGSLYNCQTNNDCLTPCLPLPTSLVKILAVKNKHVLNKSLVVLCPYCYDVYEDIYMCGYHCTTVHNELPYYTVCPVVTATTIVIDATNPSCTICNKVFSSHKQCNLHMKAADHFPYGSDNKNECILCQCPFCNEIFYNNFSCAKMHVLKHNKHSTSLVIKNVRRPTEADVRCIQYEQTLVRNDVHIWKSFDDEILILTNMKRFLKAVQGSKKKWQLAKCKLAYLKKHLMNYS